VFCLLVSPIVYAYDSTYSVYVLKALYLIYVSVLFGYLGEQANAL